MLHFFMVMLEFGGLVDTFAFVPMFKDGVVEYPDEVMKFHFASLDG